MVGAIPTFFLAFNMIADDLVDKKDIEFPHPKCPMKYLIVFMKTVNL